MKKFKSLLIACLILAGCENANQEPVNQEPVIKTDRYKLQEIFDDQYNKVLYHSTMQIKHLYTNYPLSKKHLDSLLMSGYVMDVVHEKMQEK